MPLLNLVIVLIVIGVLMWLVNKYIPMAEPYRTIINILVIVVICIWLLQTLGIWGSGPWIGPGRG